MTVCWVKRDKNGNKSQFKSFKRDKSVGTFVGTLEINKTRTAYGKGYRTQFDSRLRFCMNVCFVPKADIQSTLVVPHRITSNTI